MEEVPSVGLPIFRSKKIVGKMTSTATYGGDTEFEESRLGPYAKKKYITVQVQTGEYRVNLPPCRPLAGPKHHLRYSISLWRW